MQGEAATTVTPAPIRTWPIAGDRLWPSGKRPAVGFEGVHAGDGSRRDRHVDRTAWADLDGRSLDSAEDRQKLFQDTLETAPSSDAGHPFSGRPFRVDDMDGRATTRGAGDVGQAVRLGPKPRTRTVESYGPARTILDAVQDEVNLAGGRFLIGMLNSSDRPPGGREPDRYQAGPGSAWASASLRRQTALAWRWRGRGNRDRRRGPGCRTARCENDGDH